MEFLELVETIRAEEASMGRLLGGEGTGVRSRWGQRQPDPRYLAKLAEAADLVAAVYRGSRRAALTLQEAMTTSDFPLLFGDILDRQVLAAYREYPSTWRNYVTVKPVRDFRTVKRFPPPLGADSELAQVVEKNEYPEAALTEQTPYTYAVAKYGRRMNFSWESFINDDLDQLRDAPVRFGRAARRSESRFATKLFVDANGPHASLYTAGNANIVTGNPVLSIAAMQTAMITLAAQTMTVDGTTEPILIEMVDLVVPPALEITAQNILNAVQLWLEGEAGGTAAQKLVVQNWMKTRFRLNIDPYIPLVASSANGSTSWFLFASSDERPALEMGFLRGYEEPQIFMKSPNATRVGGGAINPLDGDFDTDSIEYKVRHIFGGTREDPKMTVASNGSGVA